MDGPMEQRILQIPSNGLRLHGLWYEPVEPTGRLLILCDPFAEEKKCAHRPLTDFARGLCAEGYVVVRFDYRGCGDSEGDFGQFTPADWLQDLLATVEHARGVAKQTWLGLAGLRLGAALASQAAVTCQADALILWEPILDGKRYVSQNLRRSMIKAMLTEGEKFDAQSVAERQESDLIDFDGYEVSQETRRWLEGLQMGAAEATFGGPTLVLNIGPREEPGEAYGQLAQGYPKGTALGLRLEPFWNRIGLIDCSPALSLTLDWLRTHCEA